MAKDLPYFKFNVSEYINGNITLEDFYVQGVFINVCAFYWFKSGKVTITEINRRLSKAKPKAFEKLVESNLIKVENEYLKISFLDEQLNERVNIAATNSENGKRGGRGNKSETKATALISESETLAKKSNIEEKREEEKREREESATHGKGKLTITIKKVFAADRVQRIHDLKVYFTSTGQLHSMEESGWIHFEEFMKANSGKVFNEPDHLYNTFRNFCIGYTQPVRAPNEFIAAEVDLQNFTLEAWMDTYGWHMKNNEAFKKHFDGKLSPSQPMGSNDKH